MAAHAHWRLSEIPSQGYELLAIPNPAQPLVHVHADADELGRLYRPAQAIHATPRAFAAALGTVRPTAPRQGHAEAAHAEYRAWSDPAPIRIPGDLQMGAVMQHLKEVLPADAIFCNGAGNFATWVHRFWPFTTYASQRVFSMAVPWRCTSAVGSARRTRMQWQDVGGTYRSPSGPTWCHSARPCQGRPWLERRTDPGSVPSEVPCTCAPSTARQRPWSKPGGKVRSLQKEMAEGRFMVPVRARMMPPASAATGHAAPNSAFLPAKLHF